jgi:hypothetical protein
MSRNLLRIIIVFGLLAVGISVVYAPTILSSTLSPVEPVSAADVSSNQYVADLDFWQRTPRESTITSPVRFDLDADLNQVPLKVADWTGEDMPETNEEVMILLEPEQYVRRLYQNDAGQYVWLTMIGGRSSQPFHAPDICYDADGWQYDLGSHAVPLEDGSQLYGLWLEADKLIDSHDTPVKHVVYYFYLFPDKTRNLADGIVLFKLTSAEYGSLEETLEMQGDFVRGLFGTQRS